MAVNAYNNNDAGVTMKFEDNTVTLAGSIDSQNPTKYMTPFLKEVHDKVLKQGVRNVLVNISDLSFLNSSGIKEFVDWIIRLESLTELQKYTIKFLCSYKYPWQETSIGTLTLLNPELVKFEMK